MLCRILGEISYHKKKKKRWSQQSGEEKTVARLGENIWSHTSLSSVSCFAWSSWGTKACQAAKCLAYPVGLVWVPPSIVNAGSKMNMSCSSFSRVPSVSIISSCRYFRIRPKLAILLLTDDAEQDRLWLWGAGNCELSVCSLNKIDVIQGDEIQAAC